MTQKINLSLVTAIFALLWSCVAWSQVPPDVSVRVSQQVRQNGTALYQYKVVNNSGSAIVGLSIGSDYYHGTSELSSYPLGWSFDTGIPDGSALSPVGWNAIVITTEESPFVEIAWRNNGISDIQPNQTMTGFGVVVPAPNALYLSSHWTVYFADATAASNVLIVDGNPRIEAKIISANQLSPDQWSVSLQMANNGGGTAQNVNVTQVAFRTLAGVGAVSMVSPNLPVTVGNLGPGTKLTLVLVLNVPGSVKSFLSRRMELWVLLVGGALHSRPPRLCIPKTSAKTSRYFQGVKNVHRTKKTISILDHNFSVGSGIRSGRSTLYI